MLKEKIGLIPRYNWDYDLIDFYRAFFSAFKKSQKNQECLKKVFGQIPIYTNSGRTSLYSILKALSLPEGSRIGVPLFCCPVVFDAIQQANLAPTFLDINPEDYNISASDLEKKKSSLSAIIVVHMFGHPADMDSISAVAGDIPIIEDCAQSLFSKYKGQYTGFLSQISFFSFRSGKYISAGEGSAVFTGDSGLRSSIESITDRFHKPTLSQELIHCMATYMKSTLYNRPWYGTVGFPIGKRLDQKLNLTAKNGFELGRIKKTDMKIISDRIGNFFIKVKKQRENSIYLLENLRTNNVFLPNEKDDCWTNYYQFAIRFEDSHQRDAMADFLFQQGIDNAKYLNEVLDVVKDNYSYKDDCPKAELCSKTVLSIPNHYTLSKKDLDHIVSSVNQGSQYLKTLGKYY